jgi:hypothetical protein
MGRNHLAHASGDAVFAAQYPDRARLNRPAQIDLKPSSSLTVGEAGDLQGPQGIRLRPRALAGRGLSFECGLRRS